MAPSSRFLLLAALSLTSPAWSQGVESDNGAPDLVGQMKGLKQKTQAQSKAEAAVEARYAAERSRLLPKAGHGSPNPYAYDIWNHNCHTAANSFLIYAPDKTKAGIVACGGDPMDNPADHTYNWIVLPSQTCLVNWGTPCCWRETAVPPNIASGPGLACAQKFCDKQYGKNTRTLPPGQNVERPSEAICAVMTEGGTAHGPLPAHPDTSPSKEAACLKCCDSRSDMWKWDKEFGPQATFEKERTSFRSKCRNFCDAIFN